MKKTVKKIGNSLGVTFNKEECRNNNIEFEDILDFSDMIVIKKKKGKKK